MLTIRSDYSPQAAPEKQELDNLKAIQMLLVVAGLSTPELIAYNKATEAAAKAYDTALGEPEEKMEHGRNIHSKAQWRAAVAAAQPDRDVAEQILITAGITIENNLEESEDEQVFAHIITTVHNDYGDNPVAQIVRAIVDIEAEHYEENVTGFGLTPRAA